MIWEISEMTSAASSSPSIWVMHATKLQMQLRYEKKNIVPIRQLSHCAGTGKGGQLFRALHMQSYQLTRLT